MGAEGWPTQSLLITILGLALPISNIYNGRNSATYALHNLNLRGEERLSLYLPEMTMNHLASLSVKTISLFAVGCFEM
jgi:hypothetical protein